ncbi:MAG TPA: hypothetical protein VG432_12925, partial [Gemmatimonadaceae bacterium]|nr:hypothetical protein [Gemmatimonadaceae bacterium]
PEGAGVIAGRTGRPEGGAGVIAAGVTGAAPAGGRAVSPGSAPLAAAVVVAELSRAGLFSPAQAAAMQIVAMLRSR